MSKRAGPGAGSDPKRVRPSPTPDGQAQQGSLAGQSTDPDELSDALRSAGVDVRAEENFLSATVSGMGSQLVHAPQEIEDQFLDHNLLKDIVSRAADSRGLRLSDSKEMGNDPLALLSAACQEWIADILCEAAIFSKHRRLSRNPVSVADISQVSRTLRQLAQQDKDAEQKWEATKASLGIGENDKDENGSGKKSKKAQQESEEAQQRASNETARMMTAGKKRFSWLSGGSSVTGRSLGGPRRQTSEPRFREVKEDPGIVLRDLLNALEEKRIGIKRTLTKGYARIRD